MRISEKDVNDCKQIGIEMGFRRPSVKASADRRRFIAWLIVQCRAGARPNDRSIGRWCDAWEETEFAKRSLSTPAHDEEFAELHKAGDWLRDK